MTVPTVLQFVYFEANSDGLSLIRTVRISPNSMSFHYGLMIGETGRQWLMRAYDCEQHKVCNFAVDRIRFLPDRVVE